MDETTPDFKLQKAFHQIKKQFKLACIEGDIQKLQKLIMTATTDGILQALVNGITGKNGWTPLMYAIKSGHLKVIKRLVESEVVELEAKNKKNYTALLLACEHEQLEVVKYLLEMGSDPCACASKYEKHESGEGTGITGLHLAAISNSSEIAEELINSKCPLHIQDTEGNTALHLAYKNSSTDVADFLQRVPGGKQLQSMTNKFGQTPSQVPPEIFIPPEIIARGLVPAYRKALKKGKQKYYRCSLLILGEVEAGKTSLLNLLTHKPFQQDLPRTEGIEDTVVDTGVWKNQQQADQIKKNRELFACGVVKALPSRENPLPTTIPKETPLPTVLEQPLPQTFEDIKTDYKPISEVMVAEDKFTQDSVTVIKKPEQHSLTVSSKKPSAEAIVSRSEADIIERILKLGETKELYLNLKVYDFAGDWKYRSMHHCYITPHALYLVVFDLQKVSKCSLADKSKTLEEIRYWLNSIHAHIHTTSKREDSLGWRKDQSEEKRVILVGTHMAPKDIRQGKPLTDDDLNEVDKMLSTEFYHKDTRYLGDIWYTGKKRRMFVAVECSRDKPDEREESGVLFLQNQLLEATAQLSFLNRLHPVVWLKFENELKRMRERNCSIVQLESIQIVGRKSGVEDVEAVLKYFHDIGTIIYPKLLPCLFLSNEELRQRDGYIVLDPKWLMTVMQNVMELQRGAGQSVMKYRGYEVDIQKLKKTGIVTIALLKKCWECHTAPDSFAQLCLILQSYGLICTYIDQNCDDIHHYLIPCKLPPKFPEHPLVGNRIITFYFDFEGFLPSVIFHRFICLMSMESNPDRESHFSDRCCRVYTKQGWTMQLDFETHFQRLKVSVVTSKEDKLPPINYVSVIHKEFLHKICKNSGLEGLKFTGGPMFKCKTGCKVDTRDKCMYLLPCVKYSVRHPEIQDCLEQVCCTGTCGETYNANHWLLNPMDQDLCNSGADSSDAVLNKPLGSCEDGAHKRLTHRRDKIIQYLATFVSPERLADKLVAAGLITDDTRNKALVPAATIQDRIRPMIDVIIIMTELNSAKYDKFIEVLKEFRALEDVIKFIESPVDIMPVEQ